MLEAVVGGRAHLVGWSDGGVIGLLVALRRPDLVDRMVLIGANFHFDGVTALDLPEDSPVAKAMVEAYAERSPDGREHFGETFGKFMAMVTTEPTLTTDDLGRITAPTLVMAGDDDAVLLPHTCEMYEALPAGQLAIVPRTSHALPLERPDVTARIVLDFLGPRCHRLRFCRFAARGRPPDRIGHPVGRRARAGAPAAVATRSDLASAGV